MNNNIYENSVAFLKLNFPGFDDLDDETRERLIAVFVVCYGLCVFNAFMKAYNAYKNKALK